MTQTANDNQWFAMRATYGRNLMAQNVLNENGIRTFMSMQYARLKGLRHSCPQLVAIIRGLIFVRTARQTIAKVKKRIPYLHYIMHSGSANREPAVMSDQQMNRFIAVSGTPSEQLVWLSPENLDFKRGDAARINSGAFAGFEGILMRVPGKTLALCSSCRAGCHSCCYGVCTS